MIAVDNHDNTKILIPLTNVTGTILAKVIEYCEKHAADNGCITDVEKKNRGVEFVSVDATTLTHLTKAASFLKIKTFQNLTLQKVAEMIKYKTTGEILNALEVPATSNFLCFGLSMTKECSVKVQKQFASAEKAGKKMKDRQGKVSVEKKNKAGNDTLPSKTKRGNEIDDISSSKKKKGEQDKVEKQDKPIVKGKKLANEIDEIFAIKKKRKKELEEVEKAEEKESFELKKSAKKMNRSRVSEGVAFVDPPSRPRRKTNDGLTIYSETELGIANSEAGGTRLCPFDCSCCF
ncbi:hypothetical protein MKW98_030800 [Papaver atlanticum]|uniref:SKP1 component POZ domain-containing protein n=1 Tax=Papaver atlanticum TaxID=357466 RepID=A0AAD4S237_9MAGN|nr:hypothetical protein MKW98_030800 [Papaver atlanticum]